MKQSYKRRLWTPSEIKIVQTMFADNYTEDVCKLLKRSYGSVVGQAAKMGLRKSAAFLKMELKKQAKRLKKHGAAHRFTKGTVPQNKGIKMPIELYVKCQPTMFKKGQVPHNAYNDWQEVIRNDSNGKQYYMIKLPNRTRLMYKHIWLWETANGQVPKGYNVVFKNGNTLHCTIENLECISNAELMYRNSKIQYPKEIIPALTMINKIKKYINAKQNQ